MTENLKKLLRDFSEELKIDASVQKYQAARESYLDDMKLMALITEYNTIQTKMEEEAQKETTNSDEISELDRKSEEFRKEIFENATYKAYQNAEEDINVLLATINGEIMSSITGEENEDSCGSGGCSGNCSHCH
ncbi:MAG: hypothetical protein A2Y17_01275 [Clostridiales bacterium GWF2_38_85]|nr:MAG: hypothetical protein A2Y17_01275 [Clostridiales bacterium GWF2_38_85]HBL85151.1 hypothetical protein [Clostridiales bacterium]